MRKIIFNRYTYAALLVIIISVAAVTVFWPVPERKDDEPARFRLGLPLACTPGEDCWIPNYVDHDAGNGLKDYYCGTATYNAAPFDRHRGTDFAVRDMAAVRNGVTVYAAADGRVASRRDGVEDKLLNKNNKAAVKGRECGNGVIIDHGAGWMTKYCHMRQGSVTVMKGDAVKRGQPIGLVGLSGQTAFPHLHFQVEKDKKAIDPFVGDTQTNNCGIGVNPLWQTEVLAKLPYVPTAIYNAGFTDRKPDQEAIRQGHHNPVRSDAPALVLWAEIFRVQAGDQIEFNIANPNGVEIFTHSLQISAKKARYFAFGGLRRKQERWPIGGYTGTITLKRETQRFSVTRNINIQ